MQVVSNGDVLRESPSNETDQHEVSTEFNECDRDKTRALVESWLPALSSAHTTSMRDEITLAQPRPSRLGLGAKFLAHSRVVATSSSDCISRKMHRKITARLSAVQRENDDDDDDKFVAQKKIKKNDDDGEDEDDDDDDDDELTRRGSSKRKKTRCVFEDIQREIVNTANSLRTKKERQLMTKRLKKQRQRARKRQAKFTINGDTNNISELAKT